MNTAANSLQLSAKMRARRRRSPTTLPPSTNPPQAGKPLKPDAAALKEVIRRAQQGDATAFETIYDIHSRRVYALCLRMIRDPVEPQDLTQDAFLQVFHNIHTLRSQPPLSSCLPQPTTNLALIPFPTK